jgi:hypothetical protein
LSVNTDGDRETLRKSIQDGEITWRFWWVGSPEGPVCQNWNVTSFPTVYALDGTGAIRFKNVDGPSLDDVVKKLLKDLEASPQKAWAASTSGRWATTGSPRFTPTHFGPE